MEKLLEIQRILLDDFEKEPFYQRDIFKTFSFSNRITGIVGMRGVGKTTFLLHQVLHHGAKEGKALYVSADNLFIEGNLFSLADRLYKESDIRFLCIDEIQKYTNWRQELKNIADTFRQLKVLFTGSSMIELITGGYDLSRRVTLYHLHGLSLREFLEFYYEIRLSVISVSDLVSNHVEIAQTINLAKPIKYLKEYLKMGYFPFYKNLATDHEKYQAVVNAAQKTIYEDISTLHSLKTPSLLVIEKIYKYILSSQPGEISAYKLSKALEKDFETVSEYVKFLEQAGLIRFLYTSKTSKGLLKHPIKIYPENTNAIYANYIPLIEDSSKGKMREVFVLNQLQNSNNKVFYTPTGDFKVEKFTFEIGGKNKTNSQVKNVDNAYILADDIIVGYRNKIPLYLVGFLY